MFAISSCKFPVEARVSVNGRPGMIKVVLPKSPPERLPGPLFLVDAQGGENKLTVPGKVCFAEIMHNTTDQMDLILKVVEGEVTTYGWIGQDGASYRIAARGVKRTSSARPSR
jgi:hypothetical protein